MLLNCVVGEDSWESLGLKEIKPVNPKGNHSWIFIGRIDAEGLIFWISDVKSWCIGKDPDAGKDWRQEKKGTTEDEVVRWHHRLDGHEFEQAPKLGVLRPWGCKELNTTERQNWLNLSYPSGWPTKQTRFSKENKFWFQNNTPLWRLRQSHPCRNNGSS